MAILSAVFCLVGCLSIAGVLPPPMDHPIFPLAAFACGTVAAFVRRPVAWVWLVINVGAVIVWLWLLQERSRLGGQ